MIAQIFKYLWNKRRSNTWIFFEIVLVTFFMWSVIDPVYVLLSNKAIDGGYDTDNVYLLTFNEYGIEDSKYNETYNNDSLKRVNFEHIYRTVGQHPEIETVAIPYYSGTPYSQWTTNFGFANDTLSVLTLKMRFHAGTDYFGVFRIKDVETGEIMKMSPEDLTNDQIYMSENIIGAIFPEGKKRNESVFIEEQEYKVAGITPNFKFQSTEQPIPVIFMPMNAMDFSMLPASVQICFRVKEGINKQLFLENFQQEYMSRLEFGNFYALGLTDFNTIRVNSEYLNGITNAIDLQIGLAVFFLLCTFLGISGTFWLRSNERKSEIGLRMALGGSRATINKEFLIEAWLLTTGGWLIGIILALQRVSFEGFAYEPYNIVSSDYIQNHAVPHFIIVSLIVYTMILLIVVIGTLIPAYRASITSPAVSLHDE